MEPALLPVPDDDVEEDEAAAGAAVVVVEDEDEGFEAGVLLDEAPRLSFR
ncbi:hypothetical protein Slala03_35160 [Streptomyces lavendulae subsp. lavendulae]|nr:hypothetical protein Slala03_35160 [Streptomyces lavendulae subsp. lavendulae]GLX38044.1 hypothetical protein Sros01_41170 [Streptomyces roseochromogenus]